MTANTNPIFSRLASIGYSPVLTAAAADYVGQNVNNALVFVADTTNGSFVQRLRFKALGTNVATVARVYLNSGNRPTVTNISAVSGTPTGTPSSTGGTLVSASYFMKVYAVDQYGGTTAGSTETAAVAVTGPTGSITWNWTVVAGAASYVITVGTTAGAELVLFTSTTNSYVQTTAGDFGSWQAGPLANNNVLFDEVTLPATTAIANAATAPIDLPMNFALPPGWSITVGLGTAVAAGWQVTTLAGVY